MLSPGSGTGTFAANAAKMIRLHLHGCTNRPFFHIVVTERRRSAQEPVIEQLGTYDPIPNEYNEKLLSLNLERIRFWMGNGAQVTRPAAQLLGLAGFLPIHPSTYIKAWRNRQTAEKSVDAQKPPAEDSVKGSNN